MPWYFGVVAQENLGACMDQNGAFFGFGSMEGVPPLTGVQVKDAVEAGPQLTPLILPMYVAQDG